MVEGSLQVALTQIGHFGPGDDVETEWTEDVVDESGRLVGDAGGVDGQQFFRLVVDGGLDVGLEGPDEGDEDQTVGFQRLMDVFEQSVRV